MRGSIVLSCVLSVLLLGEENVLLDGINTQGSEILKISNGARVEIKKEALDRVEKSHQVLIDAAKEGHKIYGLTVGVGLNKDREMVNAQGELSQEVIDASKKFNLGLIRAHCGGVGDDLDPNTVRAIMAVRLNNMLYGGSGVSGEVVEMYQEFLNKDIIPAVPKSGSMGEADITILGHIGLAMIGEGDVYYGKEYKKIPAQEALRLAGLKQLEPFGKDSLSILSSNAYSSAVAILAIEDLRHLSKMLKLVYALSLEGLNGNVAPFLAESAKLRPFPDFVKVASELREILQDSYLWQKDDLRALQDPLSYRDGAYLLSTLDTTLGVLDQLMQIQINSSDDNPGVSIVATKQTDAYQEEKVFTRNGGAVVPTANFDPIIWVLELEKASIALAHNSKASAQRTIKLSDDSFAHLSRFLGTQNSVHAFGAMQKPFVVLSGENQALANPVSLNYMPVAGNIEDVATNAPLVVSKLQKQIDNMYYILGIELMHAAQAIDLRKQKNPQLKLSIQTQKLYEAYRKQVEFLDQDRPLSDDFRKSAQFLREYK